MWTGSVRSDPLVQSIRVRLEFITEQGASGEVIVLTVLAPVFFPVHNAG